jgi:toluene monooxygenase system ferredoxin subunit
VTWKKVCAVGDVALNTVKIFDIDGINILIANYGTGFRALPPVCPHMEEPLVESGILVTCVLTCSKHLWAWNLTTLEMLGETEKPLKFYNIKELDGALFVDLAEELLYEFESEDEFDDGSFFGQS